MWYINIKNFSCTFYCNLSFLDQIFLIFGPKVPLNTFLGPLESSKKHKIGTNWEFYLYICLYIYIYLYIYIIKVYIFFFQKFWRFPPVLASCLFSIHLLEMKYFWLITPLCLAFLNVDRWYELNFRSNLSKILNKSPKTR